MIGYGIADLPSFAAWTPVGVHALAHGMGFKELLDMVEFEANMIREDDESREYNTWRDEVGAHVGGVVVYAMALAAQLGLSIEEMVEQSAAVIVPEMKLALGL